MSFKKRVDNNIIPDTRIEKDNIIYYIYKNDIEDDLDEQLLFSEAFNKINENEEFNIIKYIGNIWYGISSNCNTCIYIDLNDDDIDIQNIIKLVDKKKWKLNAGFMYLDNNYNKIIITSTKSPSELFPKSNKWKNIINNFKIQQL